MCMFVDRTVLVFSSVKVTSSISEGFKNCQQSLVSFLIPIRDLSIDSTITSKERGKGQSSALVTYVGPLNLFILVFLPST